MATSVFSQRWSWTHRPSSNPRSEISILGSPVADATLRISIVKAPRNHSSIFVGLRLFKIEQMGWLAETPAEHFHGNARFFLRALRTARPDFLPQPSNQARGPERETFLLNRQRTAENA
jgi:hypothetical protein